MIDTSGLLSAGRDLAEQISVNYKQFALMLAEFTKLADIGNTEIPEAVQGYLGAYTSVQTFDAGGTETTDSDRLTAANAVLEQEITRTLCARSSLLNSGAWLQLRPATLEIPVTDINYAVKQVIHIDFTQTTRSIKVRCDGQENYANGALGPTSMPSIIIDTALDKVYAPNYPVVYASDLVGSVVLGSIFGTADVLVLRCDASGPGYVRPIVYSATGDAYYEYPAWELSQAGIIDTILETDLSEPKTATTVKWLRSTDTRVIGPDIPHADPLMSGRAVTINGKNLLWNGNNVSNGPNRSIWNRLQAIIDSLN